jgi:hypothetical protein
MLSVANTLRKLSWPVDQMTDEQIANELYRRWFDSQPEGAEELDGTISVAAIKGMFVSMAQEGNLDALCWSVEDHIPEGRLDLELEDEQHLFCREQSEDEIPEHDRRRSKREPAKDFVRWHFAHDQDDGATGWLVDRSAEGIAFIAQVDEVPAEHSEIIPTICSRTEGVLDLGVALVVRIEPLSEELSLVCAQLEAARLE